MNKLKLAVCIPCYADPKGKFMQSLLAMVTHTLQADLTDADGNDLRVQLETFIVSSSMLTEGRHRLVAEALVWGADYMLWLDADHVFPHDTFCRLWAHGLPVVGANYPRRCTPTGPTAAYFDPIDCKDKVLYTTQEKAEAALVEPCSHLGFGVCLVNMKVFDTLQAHAEKVGDGNFMPLFKFEPTENKVGMIGEDVYFFRKLRDAGIVPFVDHGLSWEVGHIFELVLTNAHTISQKDKWEEVRNKRGAELRAEIERLEQDAESGLVS